MTLKQSVEDPHSPLRAFFNARLPNMKTVHAHWKQVGGTGICIGPPVDTIVAAGGGARRYPVRRGRACRVAAAVAAFQGSPRRGLPRELRCAAAWL